MRRLNVVATGGLRLKPYYFPVGLGLGAVFGAGLALARGDVAASISSIGTAAALLLAASAERRLYQVLEQIQEHTHEGQEA